MILNHILKTIYLTSTRSDKIEYSYIKILERLSKFELSDRTKKNPTTGFDKNER